MTNGIGNTIKKYRIAKGLAQKELAGLVGVTPTYMSQIEKGKSNPSYSLLEKLCQQLGIEQRVLYKDLFIGSILREGQSDQHTEIMTLLQVVLDRVTDIQANGSTESAIAPEPDTLQKV